MSRLLVVEDEKSMRDLLALMLGKEGYQVDVAPSATDACEMFATHDPWDLIISDISMPGMSGMEFLKVVRERSPQTAVILGNTAET